MELSRNRMILIAVVAAAIVVVSTAGAYFLLLPSGTTPTAPPTGPQTRRSYIESEPILWNYTPSGMNEITGQPFSGETSALYSEPAGINSASEQTFTTRNATYLGTTYMKCVYRGYTDASFTTPTPRAASDAYLGLLGPVLYVAVGDTIQVTFYNTCPFATSIAAQGVQTGKAWEGVAYNDTVPAGPGASVATGSTTDYTWQVPASAGPGPMDGASVVWRYTSGASPSNGTDAGLQGAIIVSAAGAANADGTPEGIVQNIVLAFTIDNEANSPFLDYNVAHYALDPTAVATDDPNWDESNLKYDINGYLFGNMPMIDVPAGQHVRWYFLAQGSDMLAPDISGNAGTSAGVPTQVRGLFPGMTATVDMWANNTGVWLVDSQDSLDLIGGMITRYSVDPSAAVPGSVAIAPAQAVVQEE